MDQCEDREEGVPPSKSTLCGEHESQTKAQRNQPGPPPSSVSLRSDRSNDRWIDFKVQPVSVAERLTEVHKKMKMEEEEDRAESAGSSCPSVRSDQSKETNPDFSGEPGPTRGQRSQSAGSSCPSVRSDRSKETNPDFSGEPGPTRIKGRPAGPEPEPSFVNTLFSRVINRFQQKQSSTITILQKLKTEHGPEPSCVSLKSDRSKGQPINLKVQPVSAAERINGRPAGPEPEPSCVSLQSNWSHDRPINFKLQPVSAAER